MSSILTVSQLNRYIGSKIKGDTKLRGVAVKGEISNFSVHYRTGHMFFSLKDEESIVKAVMFVSNAEKLKFMPEAGMNVVAFGNMDVYQRDGVYQIVVTDMQPVGIGTQSASLELLKKKLSELGVFSTEAKRKIPAIPKSIAVVTSPGGAALQDILAVLQRRYPVCRVMIFPTTVQGLEAPDQIADAIETADNSGADTLIVSRGGGASETLSAFNTEKVVMAVYNCNTPVISAVGHEIDTTLTDYAADLRVPTPTAAAEMAVPDMSVTISDINKNLHYIGRLIDNKISGCESKMNYVSAKLAVCSPQSKLELNISSLERSKDKLDSVFENVISRTEGKLDKTLSKLFALSPFGVLERGYSIVTKNGEPVKSSEELSCGDIVKLRFHSGEALAEINNIIQEIDQYDF